MVRHILIRVFIASLLLIILVKGTYSQPSDKEKDKDRPKIGLVLSGGAAKGIAHVGVLKVLEEIGIQPDYITGTSMGAIVGGLYSIGYSADDLAELADTTDWNKILTDQVPLNKIAMEEKEDFERYFLELPIRDYEFKLPSGLTAGYQLEKLFNDFTWGSTGIEDFDSLPIPFHCMAVDIIEGKPVEFDSGHLATALRASMAIPGVFSSVRMDSMMLVDGGIIRNLPVQEVIDMGADIVIAVYVGFEDEITPDELFSLSDVLTRTTIFLGVIDSREQMQLADILILPDMKGVSATDFFNSDTVVKRGEGAAREISWKLKALADSLDLHFEPVEKLEGPPFIYITDVEVENIEYVKKSFVIGQGNIFPGTYTNKKIIDRGVERIYGSRYFRKVGYRLEHIEGIKYKLIYMAKESTRARMKIAPHYNNQQGTGIVLNGTFRNYFIPSSRIKLTANIAENPGVELVVQKYFGKSQQIVGQHFTFWNSTKFPVFYEGNRVGNYRHVLFQSGIGGKYSINFNQQFGLDFFYERNSVKPGGAVKSFYPQADFENYIYGGFAYKGYYKLNTLNDMYFATRGSKVNIGFKRVLEPLSSYRIEGDQRFEEELFNLGLKPFNTIELNVDSYIELIDNLSMNLGTAVGLTSTQTPVTNHFALGGKLYADKNQYETFYGLHFGEQIVANFWKVNGGFNYKLFPRVFATAIGNIAVTGEELDQFIGDIGVWKSKDHIMGYAAGLRFNTFIGPLVLMLGDNNIDSHVRWYVSFGFSF